METRMVWGWAWEQGSGGISHFITLSRAHRELCNAHSPYPCNFCCRAWSCKGGAAALGHWLQLVQLFCMFPLGHAPFSGELHQVWLSRLLKCFILSKKKRKPLQFPDCWCQGMASWVSKERFQFPCQQQEIIIFILWGQKVWKSSHFCNSPWSIFAFNYKTPLVSQGNLVYSYLALIQKTAKLTKPSNLEMLLHPSADGGLAMPWNWAVPGIRSPSGGGHSKELGKNNAEERCCGLLA